MRYYLALILVICSFTIFSQQDVQFTHFKEYELLYNPAYAGVSEGVCGDLLGRNQWAGFEGAPKSLFFDTRYASRKLHGGIGLTILADKLGFQQNTLVSVSYAYKLRFEHIGNLYLGISTGFNKGNWTGNFIPPETLTDPNIPISGQSASIFNSNIGIYYTRRSLYAGLSVTGVNQGVFKSISNPQFNFQSVRHFYVLAGYKKKLVQRLDLEPSIFAKSDGVSTQIDLKTKLLFDNQFFVGMNYRVSDAVSPILGIYLYGDKDFKLIVSYSYDITTSKIRNYSSGSHEIALSFCKKITTPLDRHVNPRNLGALFL